MVSALEEADSTIDAARVPMHPLGRLGRPEEVAERLAWLTRGRASFVTGTSDPEYRDYLAR